jgi:hypothetical protein
MQSWMTRRHLMRLAAGVIGTAVGSGDARAVANVPACYWRKADSDCSGGTLRELWCYRCCDEIGCEDAFCEWREVGTC